jgi:hypothetical protein
MRKPFAVAVLSALASSAINADEGMWTFDNVPTQRIQDQFGVQIDDRWLDRVRLATVRLAGCTASFVSQEGLILTNHHCITRCLAENSTKEKSLLDDGFIARSREGEISCPTQVADVLVAMSDVTDKVAAATTGLDEKAANDARRQARTRLEQSCEAETGLKCQTVSLYNGGQYFLYQYRRYTDIRLVFAPEAGIAAFGGDPDNFQFPRWCLDMAFLRAYENGEPVAINEPLRFNFAGPTADELVFVSGHPGSTDRLLTVSQLQALRDTVMPQSLLRASELRGRYIQFSKQGDEQRRIVADTLSGLENGIKVRRKLLDALLNENLMQTKRDAEAALRRAASQDARLADLGDPWSEIAAAVEAARDTELDYTFIEGGAGFNSQLFRMARALWRAAEERSKPNDQRLREYTDASLPRLRQQVTAAAPIYPEVEALTLSFGFERMREWLGPDHPIVRQLLTQDSPDGLAEKLIAGTRLMDPTERVRLWDASLEELRASQDPFIKLARDIDRAARGVRKQREDEIDAVIADAEERIARARFTLFGTEVYPDATFTLRLNFGTVRGWRERGRQIEPFTRLETAFARATGEAPFAIPASWLARRDRLNPDTPFNLSTNNDIVGGNSGSPLLNAQAEIVGLIFDGNIHSISGSYGFDPIMNRSVAVHPAIMKAALEEVYEADAILSELNAQP